MSTNQSLGFLEYLARVQIPVENYVFKQNKVLLDGYTFKNCAFIGCHLHTSVGNFVLDSCFIGAGTMAVFSADAVKVVKLATLMDWNTLSPNLKATQNPDGGITIK